jgi:hypothetical protein
MAALGAAFLRRDEFLRFRPRPFCGDGATFSPIADNSLSIRSNVPPVPEIDVTRRETKFQHF